MQILIRIVKLIVSLFVAAIDFLMAVARRVLTGRHDRAQPVVLYYHAIPSRLRREFATQMDHLVRLTEPVGLTDEDRINLSCGRRRSAVTFDDAFVSVAVNALPELQARQIPCTIFVPTGSLGRPPKWLDSPHPDAGEAVMSPRLLREIAADPLVSVGSHSVSHPDFRHLDDARARDELSRSKSTLEDLLRRPVQSFSFPHGAYTRRSLELARECGYRRVFTIEPTQARGSTEEFTVGRVRVEPTDWLLEFRLKAVGAYRWMVYASAVKRRLLWILRGRRAPLSHAGSGL